MSVSSQAAHDQSLPLIITPFNYDNSGAQTSPDFLWPSLSIIFGALIPLILNWIFSPTINGVQDCVLKLSCTWSDLKMAREVEIAVSYDIQHTMVYVTANWISNDINRLQLVTISILSRVPASYHLNGVQFRQHGFIIRQDKKAIPVNCKNKHEYSNFANLSAFENPWRLSYLNH